jgi:hypothetical protein
MKCEQCFASMVPYVPTGGTYPSSGYKTSFRDFKDLLTDNQPQNEIRAALREWFGYEVSDEGEDLLVLNERGEAIDLLWLHLRLQSEPERQYRVYGERWKAWH